jgi:hypothetical protein
VSRFSCLCVRHPIADGLCDSLDEFRLRAGFEPTLLLCTAEVGTATCRDSLSSISFWLRVQAARYRLVVTTTSNGG